VWRSAFQYIVSQRLVTNVLLTVLLGIAALQLIVCVSVSFF